MCFSTCIHLCLSSISSVLQSFVYPSHPPSKVCYVVVCHIVSVSRRVLRDSSCRHGWLMCLLTVSRYNSQRWNGFRLYRFLGLTGRVEMIVLLLTPTRSFDSVISVSLASNSSNICIYKFSIFYVLTIHIQFNLFVNPNDCFINNPSESKCAFVCG